MRCNRLFVLLTIAVVCVFLTTGFQGCDDDGDTPPIGSGPSSSGKGNTSSPNTPAVDVFPNRSRTCFRPGVQESTP